ncbi:MAG: 4Fe-4S dicluster domain-containing protein [Pseudomonadota bacterium]
MSVHFITANRLLQLLHLLRQRGELHAPLKGEDGVVRFAPLAAGILPELDALRTLLPPKKYLLPPRETILTYRDDTNYQDPQGTPPPLILFGLHPCDLAGIGYLDRIFLGDYPDPVYASRRSALTLIGTNCSPDQFCSCHLPPSSLSASHDLFLQRIDDGFAVSSGSPRGDELLGTLAELIEERGLAADDTRRFFGRQLQRPPQSELDPSLPDWQELAEHCLGCGACSICCPTCYCFDVLEFGGLDGRSAERLRHWDNCLFKSHAQVAGGASFQKDRAQRFRYRYRHKYRGFGQLKGIPSCVGCGRCRTVCPAGLDLRPLAEKLERGAS